MTHEPADLDALWAAHASGQFVHRVLSGAAPDEPPYAVWVPRREPPLAEFGGDAAAVALTGLSLGGNGAWHLALAAPERFTALAIVCGWLEHDALPPALREAPDPYRATAAQLRHLPVWLFHGTRDPVIPVAASRVMHEAFAAVGAAVRYTEYPEVRHGAWRPAYGEPALLPWLLAPAAAPAAVTPTGVRAPAG